MRISNQDAFGLYTKKLVATYNERNIAPNFLNTFFKEVTTDTLLVSIAVSRDNEKIAVDVERGTDGRRNVFNKTTEKLFMPPYFNEYWDMTSLDHYDELWRQASTSARAMGQLIQSGVDKTLKLQDKIDRTYELYRAQVLQSGIVTFQTGEGRIDFKRKAGSMVDLGIGNYWDDANVNPYTSLEAANLWIRQNGKGSVDITDMIFGSKAFASFMGNAVVLGRQNLFNLALDNIAPPQRNVKGGVYHGIITIGSYKARIWTYPEFYTNDAGVSTPYIDPNNVIVLAPDTEFLMTYAAVPQLIDMGEAPATGAFLLTQFTDPRKKTREFHVESAGVPVPVTIDKFYTIKAVD